ncbi:hypothetical protein AK830_g6652 [Neonectria ditissima]|uniref:Uncharacterized protein n=1 Tax=Neonectria ditissima TaxID=78410 RepID=A0A0P7AZQ2_9HYPO|nr:hypothetical protein AK830_g6652 [Neonectria ditissima]
MSKDKIGDRIEWGIEVDFLVAKEQKDGSCPKDDSDPKDDSGPKDNSGPKDDTRWACPADDPHPTETCAKYCAEIIKKHALLKGRVVGGVGYRGDVAPIDNPDFNYLDRSANRPGITPSMSHWFFCPAPNAKPLKGSPEGLDWVGIRMRCPMRQYTRVMPRGAEMAQHDSSSTESSGGDDDDDDDESVAESVSHSVAESVAATAGISDPPTSREETPTPPPTRRNRIEIETILGLLRATIKMHTNSTCQLRIHFTLRPDGFDLVHYKKMLTFCWMMEPHLMLVLRPDVKDPKSNHYLPLTVHSELAKVPTLFEGGYMKFEPPECQRLLESKRPKYPHEQEVMDKHIGKFNDSCLQQRIQQIWSTTTIEELSELLESPDGETTVAIQMHDGKAHPTIQLRYTVWHPAAEGMQNWLQLFGRLCYAAVGSEPSRFKEVITKLEVNTLLAQKHEAADRWKTVLTHAFDNSMSFYWDQFLLAMSDNGILTKEKLDDRGILEPVPGINVDDETDSNSSSSSSSSNSSSS